jgi:hypothetical protein
MADVPYDKNFRVFRTITCQRSEEDAAIQYRRNDSILF